MRIYNLFPLLAGQYKDWGQHIERASKMGFDWIFVNPIQKTGESGSLYSIADYFQLHPLLTNKGSRKKPEKQLQEVIKQAEKAHGVRLMIDLVINHCAIDSDIVQQHPEWFVHDGQGNVEHPFCLEEDGSKVVWRDLARFDHQHSSDQKGLYNFCYEIVLHYIKLGFKGFRCDAAYQLPSELWGKLISEIKRKHPKIIFIAETLGCTEDQSKQTAEAGFDYIFNSSKWWDFSSPWLIENYSNTRNTAPSISFPESHDTERLFKESGNNVDVLKQRYLFSAIFSAGVMMPMGYEYGFKKSLHVCHSSPEDWETTEVDITEFITEVNAFKASYKVFQEDGPINMIGHGQTPILFLWKASNCCQEEALIILNKDPHNKQYFSSDDLYQFIKSDKKLKDLSLEYPLDVIPTPYEFGINPGMARVMVTAKVN